MTDRDTSTRSKEERKVGQRCLSIVFMVLCWVCLLLSVLTVVLAFMGMLGEDTSDAFYAIMMALIFGGFSGCFGAARYSSLRASGNVKADDGPGSGEGHDKPGPQDHST